MVPKTMDSKFPRGDSGSNCEANQAERVFAARDLFSFSSFSALLGSWRNGILKELFVCMFYQIGWKRTTLGIFLFLFLLFFFTNQ